jgi:O-antigen/teichoic acid export membrane protein
MIDADAERQAPTRVAAARTRIRVLAGYGVGKAVPGLVTFVSVPVWIATFGAANYGLFSMYWSLSLLATSLGTGWIRQAILRFAGESPMRYELAPRRYRTALEMAPVLGLGPLAVLAMGTLREREQVGLFVLAAAVGLFLQGRYSVGQALLQRDGESGAYASAEILRTVGALIVSLALSSAGVVEPWSLIVATTAGTASAMVLRRLQLLSRDSSPSGTASPKLLWRYWSFGWPMSIWLTMSACLVYADRFVLASFFNLDRAGYYAAAADMIVRGMGLVVAPIIMFMHPTFMRSWNTGGAEIALVQWRRMMRGVSWGTGVVALASVLFYLLLQDALLDEPIPLNAFAVLAASAALWQIALMAHKPLEAMNRTRLMMGTLVFCVALTLGLGMLLAPFLAELGVAVASATGAAAYVIAVVLLARKILKANVEAKP